MPEKPTCPSCGTDKLETHLICPDCRYKLRQHVDPGRIEFIASASLRDRFAAAAVQGLLSRDRSIDLDRIAFTAYTIADRMLTERRMPAKKTTPPEDKP